MNPAHDTLGRRSHLHRQALVQRGIVCGEQVDEVVEAAFFDRQPPVHIGFGHAEPRVGQQLAMQRRVVQANCRGGTRAALEYVPPPGSIDQRKTADAEYLGEHGCESYPIGAIVPGKQDVVYERSVRW